MSNLYYRSSVEVFQHRLDGLAHFFAKGAELAAQREMKDADFLGARLYPDMLPLVSQVRTATDHAKFGAGRIAGVETPVWEDTEATVEEVKGRIAKAKAYLAAFTPAQLEGVDGRKVQIKLRDQTLEFAAPAYLLHFALPNFYFHLVTAYDILRSIGVKIGKQDFFGQELVRE